MKLPSDLSIGAMQAILADIQSVLWRDPESQCWDADKEWDGDTLEIIAAVLEDHGLRPDETVTTSAVDYPRYVERGVDIGDASIEHQRWVL